MVGQVFPKPVERGPEALFRQAIALTQQGQSGAAEKIYRTLLKRHPHHLPALQNLAVILMAQERYDDAAQFLRKALNQAPNSPALQMMLGWAFHNLERYDEALERARRVAALDPKSANGHSMLARVLADVGRHDEALAAQHRAIELDPGRPFHYYQLGDISRWRADAPRLEALQDLLETSRSLPIEEQVYLNYALGRVFAESGENERAFRHQIEGGTLQRQVVKYDETFTLGLMEGLARTFDGEWMAHHLNVGDPSARPVFVVGMPRSGSTLVEQILASHPKVRALGERQFLNLAFARTCGTTEITPSVLYDAARWPNAKLRNLGAAYLEIASRDVAAHKVRVVDKMLVNFRLVGLIHAALPNARVLHAVRDPIDSCLSIFSLLFIGDTQPFSYDLGELGRYFRAYQKLMAHWHRVLPPNVMIDVRYEDVVDDVEGQARRIIGHCGLDWDPACLEFYKTDRPIRTSSHAQVRQPIYRSSVGRSQPPRELLMPLIEALNEDLGA